ncbi:MAG: hypothetical protein R3E75_10330 [Steroidobacteraceae bacterium]|nr:N-acetyltransferase [Nevskiaceae bacterium]
MSAGIGVAARIAALDAASWDRASGSTVALDRGLLAAMETADRLAPERRYFLHADGEARVAAAASLRRSPTAARPLDSLLYGRAAGLLCRLGGSAAPVLLLGPDLGYDATLYGSAPPESAAALRAVLHETCAAIEAEARRESAAVCISRVVPQACPLLAPVLEERGYGWTLERPTTWLATDWTDADGYFRQLATHHPGHAREVRREIRRFEASGGRLERLPSSAVPAQAVGVLLEQHHHRKNAESLGLTADFVALLGTRMRDDLQVYLLGPVDAPTGAALLLRRGHHGCVALVGLDRSRPLPDLAYFNLTYYGPARDAPALGLQRLDFGPGMVEMKLRRGCQLAHPRLFYRAPTSFGRTWRRGTLALHRRWFARKFRRLRDRSGEP